LEFLAPVYVKQRKSQKPDLVVALERRYDSEGHLSCYVATTLLTLAQAYANARRVKKIRQSWLSAAFGRAEGSKNHGNGLKRNCKAKRNHEEDEDEDEDDEFKFEAEIEKWVSETEGEESEDTDDSSDSTSSN
jgi:hypothetical protein